MKRYLRFSLRWLLVLTAFVAVVCWSELRVREARRETAETVRREQIRFRDLAKSWQKYKAASLEWEEESERLKAELERFHTSP